MACYGLIGRKLGHSYSKIYFEQKFKDLKLLNHRYSLFEIEKLDGLKQLLSQWGLDGFNVTIPYKETIIPMLDNLDETAAEIGAVNCVTVEDGSMTGHNTDAPAFLHTLTHSDFRIPDSTTAFILGTGGAAKAVAWALRQLGMDYRHVSRHPELHPNTISYTDFSILIEQPSILIINATPLGMFPDVNTSPVVFSKLKHKPSLLYVYDLIYNPSPTRLLREAAAWGATVKDGLEMLHLQAELSWELFRKKHWNKVEHNE